MFLSDGHVVRIPHGAVKTERASLPHPSLLHVWFLPRFNSRQVHVHFIFQYLWINSCFKTLIITNKLYSLGFIWNCWKFGSSDCFILSSALVDSFQILFLSSRYFHCDSNLKRGFLRPYETLILVEAFVYKTCTLDRDISKNVNFEERNIQMQIEMQIDDRQIHLF